MGMADDRGMRRFGRTGIEQGFEASGRAFEEQGADGGVFVGHALSAYLNHLMLCVSDMARGPGGMH